MENYLNLLTGFYQGLLAAGVDAGELRHHDTQARAIAMASSLDGITPYLIVCQQVNYKWMAEELIETFIKEIKVRP